MKIKILLLTTLLYLSSCETNNIESTHIVKEPGPKTSCIDNIDTLKTDVNITYELFNPEKRNDFKIDDYEIGEAFNLEVATILTAYNDGDINTSPLPTNWGDRLILYRHDSIAFESVPVGDPYQYQPFFYKNSINDKLIIICQLGNEVNYGGEAFIYENGELNILGQIEFECPYETEYNTGLKEIVDIRENNASLIISFKSDSLVDLREREWSTIVNSSLQYEYTDGQFRLIE